MLYITANADLADAIAAWDGDSQELALILEVLADAIR